MTLTNWHNPFGGEKYLWGNVPAIDVLHLVNNEGVDTSNGLNILFAASGDLRNVVRTVTCLPDEFKQQSSFVINDREICVVSRNVLLMLLALTSDEQDRSSSQGLRELADFMIHLWYSAFIPRPLVNRLKSKVKPLIEDACDELTSVGALNLTKKWDFTPCPSLELTLRSEHWLHLKNLIDLLDTTDKNVAQTSRAAVTLSPQRQDFRDRWYFKDDCAWTRVAKHRFREDGMLLPFGQSRSGFDIPNPSLFQQGAEHWLMSDQADPLAAWPISEVQKQKTIATRDIYGQLFAFLRSTFKAFILNINKITCFTFYALDLENASRLGASNSFDRIEMSNVTDRGYLGTRKAVALLAPLLKNNTQNKHATIICSYLNAVMEMRKTDPGGDNIPQMKRMLEYLPKPDIAPMITNPESNADMLRFWDARTLFLDAQSYFEKYTVQQIGDLRGVKMKDANTIVDPWPTGLKKKMHDAGFIEEFRALLGSSFTGVEHLVEWSKVE